MQWFECMTHRCGISAGGEQPDFEAGAHISLPQLRHTPLLLYFSRRQSHDCHTASVTSLPNKLVFTILTVSHFPYKSMLVM